VKLSLLTLISAFAVHAATCGTPFETTYRQGADLTLDLRAGDIEVNGVDTSTIRVECLASEASSDIRVDFDQKSGKLRVSGGPSNNVRIRIEIPRESNLTVRGTAGDLRVSGIRGHKDISLRAGDLTIDTGNPAEYSSVEASVKAGDLRARAFGVHKGGLFRSFRQTRSGGKYRLKASLWAGDIELR
jgi:hypothetical protein